MFTNEMKGIVKMVFVAFITAMTIAGIFHCFTYESKINKAMKAGFEAGYYAAVEDAELSSITEDQFILTFNGEEYYYHSTIGGETMKDAFNDGYNAAILDAELVESDENGYTLSFNGEINWNSLVRNSIEENEEQKH